MSSGKWFFKGPLQRYSKQYDVEINWCCSRYSAISTTKLYMVQLFSRKEAWSIGLTSVEKEPFDLTLLTVFFHSNVHASEEREEIKLLFNCIDVLVLLVCNIHWENICQNEKKKERATKNICFFLNGVYVRVWFLLNCWSIRLVSDEHIRVRVDEQEIKLIPSAIHCKKNPQFKEPLKRLWKCDV